MAQSEEKMMTVTIPNKFSARCCRICCIFVFAQIGCFGIWAQESGNPSSKIASDINKDFLDPEMDVQKWIDRFELESREIFASRREIIKACQTKPGARVADVGAGTGFFTRLFAESVGPSGWVYAIEISPKFVQHIRQQMDAAQIEFVSPILASQKSVNLPPNSIDLAFICDTYHHFEFADQTLASIRRALVDGGTLIVIDFERIPGTSRQWVIDHVRGDKGEFRKEIEAAGFTFEEETSVPGFSENYFIRFRK